MLEKHCELKERVGTAGEMKILNKSGVIREGRIALRQRIVELIFPSQSSTGRVPMNEFHKEFGLRHV
jgi:hypothetical protein